MTASIPVVRGGTRLIFDAVEGITNTVEAMHETIARSALPLASPVARARQLGGPHGLIASGVYRLIRGINCGLRESIDKAFSLLPEDLHSLGDSNSEVLMVAALNGIYGDHLEATGNSLATTMILRTPQRTLELSADALATALPGATPHLVVLVHGLCLSELSWQRGDPPGIGSRVQTDLGYTPLYLRYNTGRHISTNGREFARMLERLVASWPVPVKSITLVGHSMGGLVIRSACRYAHLEQSAWLQALQRVVCLGTPHHGSPLEKAGHAFESALQNIPYVKPLLFGRARSAGIKDLRHGSLLDEDWQGTQRNGAGPDSRRVVPLIPGVEYYFAAAMVGRHSSDPLGQLLGDLLVRPDSAVGMHRDELRRLNIKPENCRVFHGKNHFDLLSDRQVQEQILNWLDRRVQLPARS